MKHVTPLMALLTSSSDRTIEKKVKDDTPKKDPRFPRDLNNQ